MEGGDLEVEGWGRTVVWHCGREGVWGGMGSCLVRV